MIKRDLIKASYVLIFISLAFLVFYYVYGELPNTEESKQKMSFFVLLIVYGFLWFPILGARSSLEESDFSIISIIVYALFFIVIFPMLMHYYVYGHFPQIGEEREDFVLFLIFLFFISLFGSMTYEEVR